MSQTAAIKLLSDFISIPSISTDPSRRDDMQRAVDFLTTQLKELGAKVEIVGTDHSLVAGYIHVPGATSTIGIYGHYDVQPEDPRDEWQSDPFVLTEKNGKLYGRGVADNKGHVIQNLVAIKNLQSRLRLKSNILCIFEGEEESGSGSFEKYISHITVCNPRAVDVWYVTDMGMRNTHTPQIYTGLRGLLYTEISIETGTRDLHSGIYGNRVYNAAHLLSELIGDLKDSQNGHVNLPGFYDNIKYPDVTEYQRLLKIVEKDEVTRQESEQYALPPSTHRHPELDEGSSMPLTLLSKLLPSCDVHGIETGYTGPGAKTVIPRKASAKISFRLVPGQNPDAIEESFRSFLAENIPTGVKWNLEVSSKEPAFVTDIHDPWMQKTAQTLEKAFGAPVQYNRSGGSIPAAGILQELYKKPVILTGFTQPDDCIHAPNENYPREMFEKGIEVLQEVYAS